jgi:hypothetical protein
LPALLTKPPKTLEFIEKMTVFPGLFY